MKHREMTTGTGWDKHGDQGLRCNNLARQGNHTATETGHRETRLGSKKGNKTQRQDTETRLGRSGHKRELT